jgi:hypothetical protein
MERVDLLRGACESFVFGGDMVLEMLHVDNTYSSMLK